MISYILNCKTMKVDLNLLLYILFDSFIFGYTISSKIPGNLGVIFDLNLYTTSTA